MPSPFPGMDPYLEAHWGDIYTSIATYSRNQLNKQLPKPLVARIQVRTTTNGGRVRTHRSVHVKDLSANDRLVTVVVILCPSNVVGSLSNETYRREKADLLGSGVSLVEIDLFRSTRSINRVCVVRGWATGRGEVYPIRLRDKLPVIRVPLRQTDPDAVIDLQTVIDAAYDNGSYETLDYSEDAEPMLTKEDDAWADGLLRAAGKR